MRKLILVRGPICAGKSTTIDFLRSVSRGLSWIDQDCLKRAIDKERPSDWRDEIAFNTTICLARFLMQKGRNIIADIHSSIPRQYEEYKRLALENNYALFSFLLYPSLEVCQERNQRRVIPDVEYVVSEDDIRQYWKNPYQVAGETIFDSERTETKSIAEKILQETGLSEK